MNQQYLAVQLNAKVHRRDVKLDEKIVARMFTISMTFHPCAI